MAARLPRVVAITVVTAAIQTLFQAASRRAVFDHNWSYQWVVGSHGSW